MTHQPVAGDPHPLDPVIALLDAVKFTCRETRLRLERDAQRWYRVPELVARTGLPRQWWYRRQRTLGAEKRGQGPKARLMVFPHSALLRALDPGQVPLDGLGK